MALTLSPGDTIVQEVWPRAVNRVSTIVNIHTRYRFIFFLFFYSCNRTINLFRSNKYIRAAICKQRQLGKIIHDVVLFFYAKKPNLPCKKINEPKHYIGMIPIFFAGQIISDAVRLEQPQPFEKPLQEPGNC